jgi:hypothetical protein
MTLAPAIPRQDVPKVRKLAQIPNDLRRGKHFATTRLTIIKTLCRKHRVAENFVLYVAQCARRQMDQATPPERITPEKWEHHKAAMDHAIAEMERVVRDPQGDHIRQLHELLGEIVAEQNEYTEIHSGPVRLIVNRYLLVVEDALRCFVSEETGPHWAYQAARNYAERPNSRYGSGLNEASAPLVEDIARFWIDYYRLKL